MRDHDDVVSRVLTAQIYSSCPFVCARRQILNEKSSTNTMCKVMNRWIFRIYKKGCETHTRKKPMIQPPPLLPLADRNDTAQCLLWLELNTYVLMFSQSINVKDGGSCPLQAMAVHNSGGTVIVQVRQIVQRGSIPPRLVHIPGALVDKVTHSLLSPLHSFALGTRVRPLINFLGYCLTFSHPNLVFPWLFLFRRPCCRSTYLGKVVNVAPRTSNIETFQVGSSNVINMNQTRSLHTLYQSF